MRHIDPLSLDIHDDFLKPTVTFWYLYNRPLTRGRSGLLHEHCQNVYNLVPLHPYKELVKGIFDGGDGVETRVGLACLRTIIWPKLDKYALVQVLSDGFAGVLTNRGLFGQERSRWIEGTANYEQ